jgi:hypothetical protein
MIARSVEEIASARACALLVAAEESDSVMRWSHATGIADALAWVLGMGGAVDRMIARDPVRTR